MVFWGIQGPHGGARGLGAPLTQQPGLSPRPAARHLLRASLLVLHLLLRAEPARWGDIPRLAALHDGGWLHRPLQLGALLPGAALQCQQECSCGTHAEAYR